MKRFAIAVSLALAVGAASAQELDLDLNHDGLVTHEELVSAMVGRFDSLDADKSGSLSADELGEMASPEMLAIFDGDGDGLVNAAEWKTGVGLIDELQMADCDKDMTGTLVDSELACL